VVDVVVHVARKSLPCLLSEVELNVRPRGRGAAGPARGGRRAPASAGDLDSELDSFMKPDAVSLYNAGCTRANIR
jgi:hypothetical protein